jgi:hypothetical protein
VARRIAGFALRFVVVYGLLIFAWPAVRPLYRPFYCALGNALFGTVLFHGEGSARFTPKDTREDLDIEVVMKKRSAPRISGRAENKSRVMGYLPTISVVALVLATPLPWKRRRRALLAGVALVSLFVALRIAIPVVRDFSKPDALQVYHPGAFGRWLLGIADRALLGAPASFFVVPILIWVLVAFRRRDWELLDEAEPGEPA